MSVPEPHLPANSPSDRPEPGGARPDPSAGGDTSTAVPRWRRWAPWVVAAGALGGTWHWTLAHWLPSWLPGQVWPVAERELGTPLRWQALDIHPWTLQVTLRGLTVGPQAQPLLKFKSLTVQPSWESVWRLAPVLRRVTLDSPEVFVARTGPGQFNFSPLVAHWQQRHPPQPDEPDSKPARFAVFNIAIDGGAVHWRDEVLGQTHVVDALHLGVPFVSNLPSFIDAEVEPALSARVDGSPLKIDGETLPFQQGRRSQVHVRWQDIRVPAVLEAVQPFLPPAWRPQATSGTLATDLTVQFEARPSPEVPRLAVTGSVSLDGLALAANALPVTVPAGQGPATPGLDAQLSWQRLAVSGIDAQPLVRQARLGEVRLEGVQVQARPSSRAPAPVASPGKPSVTPATADAAKPVAKPAASAAAPWAWSVGQVSLQVQRLDVQPWAVPKGVPALPVIAPLSVSVKGLSGDRKAQPASWTLAWQDSAGGRAEAQGQVQAAKGEAQLSWTGTAWSLADWSQLVGHVFGAPVRADGGRLDTHVAATWTDQGLQWREGQLGVSGLQVSPVGGAKAKGVATRPANRLDWAKLDVDGVQGQWSPGPTATQNALQVARVTLQGLDASVVREAGNRWFGIDLDASGPAKPVPVPQAKPSAAAPLRVTLGEVRCAACMLRLDDRSVASGARLSLGPLQASVSGYDSARPGEPVRFQVDTRALDTGRLQTQGQLTLAPLAVDTRVQTSRIELRALQPYLDPYVNVVLVGAQPELDGRLRWQAATDRRAQRLNYAGRVGLRGLQLQDRVNAADFLRWQLFAMDGVNVGVDGQQVDAQLGRIQLRDFYGRIIVNPDGRLNLASVMRSERDGATTSVTTPQAASATPPAAVAQAPAPTSAVAAATPAASAAASPRPRLAWQQVTLSGGRVDFTDHFIQPNYSARLTQVQGEVSAVSSQQSEPATLTLSGAVDDAAPLRVSGRVQPLGPQLFTDIEGSAKGIELTRMTPYAARYAGYGIDKGTLSVTVHYKVDQGKLEASNRIFLDQFTFGAASNSPDAIKLPIQFAVSLLKNARGEIDINLPISGSINDPQFSIGGIVWQVFVNIITKAVTAPFALLGGDDGEDWGHVPFDAGSAELNDTARRRLDGLARSLTDRPALKLEATGHAEVAADTLALRQAYLDRLMKVAKSRATGVPLADVRIAAPEVDTWLAAAYKAADITKPRNALGLAKSLPVAEMRSLLMASAPVNDAALRDLANARADQVKAYLATRIAPDRVLLTSSQVDPVAQPGQGDAKLPPSRVQLVLR